MNNNIFEYSQEIIDALPQPIFVKDLEGRYCACNGAFEAYLGKSQNEILGKSVYDLSPKHLADVYYKMDQELFEHPGIQRYEAKVKFTDTTEHVVIFHKTTFFGQDGLLKGLVGIITDVTEQREIEKKSQEMQTQLFIASKMASLGNLAAGIGHEINNPLTIINGQIQLLKRHLQKLNISDEKLTKYLDTQDNALKRIVEIIKSMKTYSRGDSGELEDSQVSYYIEESVKLIGALYRSKGVEVIVDLNNVEAIVKINRGRFQQVLLNIYSNAFDALLSKTGKETKYIKTTLLKDEKSVSICIENNGPKIKEEIQERIFDNFFTTKEVGLGSGLGLALAYEMIKSMKGCLELYKSDDEVTIFRITLPL